jgi:lipoic acid synthetase
MPNTILNQHSLYLQSEKLIYGTVLENTLPVAKPKWLKVKLPIGKKYTELRSLVDKYSLNTICASGSCPNMGECWVKELLLYDFRKYLYAFLWFCGVKLEDPKQ